MSEQRRTLVEVHGPAKICMLDIRPSSDGIPRAIESPARPPAPPPPGSVTAVTVKRVARGSDAHALHRDEPTPTTQFELAPTTRMAATVIQSPAHENATRLERPAAALADVKSRHVVAPPRVSSADIQRGVQAALDLRRQQFTHDAAVVRPPAIDREARTARLYMLVALLTGFLAPVAWLHAEDQLLRSNALVYRIERAIGLALTLVVIATVACGVTILLVR